MSHDFAHEGWIVQHAVATLTTHCHGVASEAALDLAQTSFKYLLRAIEKTDVVADLFRNFHLVRGKDDRLSGTFEIEHDFLQQLNVDWIETREWFVKDQQVRIVNHGL